VVGVRSLSSNLTLAHYFDPYRLRRISCSRKRRRYNTTRSSRSRSAKLCESMPLPNLVSTSVPDSGTTTNEVHPKTRYCRGWRRAMGVDGRWQRLVRPPSLSSCCACVHRAKASSSASPTSANVSLRALLRDSLLSLDARARPQPLPFSHPARSPRPPRQNDFGVQKLLSMIDDSLELI
jgi:hypothetical protein